MSPAPLASKTDAPRMDIFDRRVAAVGELSWISVLCPLKVRYFYGGFTRLFDSLSRVAPDRRGS